MRHPVLALTCHELAMSIGSTRPGLCLTIHGNCPVAYTETPNGQFELCPQDTKCCIFDRIECRTQGDGVIPAACYTGNVCPPNYRSVPFDIGCSAGQVCCAPSAGLSCRDQAYNARPWLCIDGYCPEQYGYRSVFWNSGCPTNSHRCCI